MTTPSPQFGDLRSLCERTPSPAVFGQLVHILTPTEDVHSTKIESEWLPYVRARLERWPDASRVCPRARLDAYLSGKPMWCDLVRALDLSHDGVPERESLRQLLCHTNMPRITHLDLRSCNLDLARFIQGATIENLKGLAMRRSTRLSANLNARLFTSPMFGQVESLSFRNWEKIGSASYDALAAHVDLSALHTLDVSGGAIDVRSFQTLVDTGSLGALRTLRMGITQSMVRPRRGLLGLVARTPSLDKLDVLHVYEARDKELAALAEATHLSSLRELRIDRPLHAKQALELLAHPHFRNLERLRLTITANEPHTFIEGLLEAPVLEHLRVLDIDRDRDVRAKTPFRIEPLLASGALGKLKRLYIPVLSVDVLSELVAHAGTLPELEALTCGRVYGRPDDLERLACTLFEEQRLPKLRAFHISRRSNSTAIMEALAHTPAMHQLETLTWWYHPGQLASFLDAHHSTNLRELSIPNLRDADLPGLTHILGSSPHLARLEELVVRGPHILKSVVAAFRQNPGIRSIHVSRVDRAHMHGRVGI